MNLSLDDVLRQKCQSALRSRTHRVGLDWFFDGVNEDSNIYIRYVNMAEQKLLKFFRRVHLPFLSGMI